MDHKYKIIVAHPGQQHSYKVAEALKKEGYLEAYFTCVYDLPKSLPMKIAHYLVKGNDSNKLSKRKSEIIENEDVHIAYTFLSLCVIVLSRYKISCNFAYWLDRKISDLFGRRVAKYAIKHNVDAVICFSNNERTCFKVLSEKRPGILKVVDCANAPVKYMRDIYDEDIKKYGSTALRKEAAIYWDKKNIKLKEAGMRKTDVFLAPSCFVKRGLEYCGIKQDKIKVLHYGSNFDPITTEHKYKNDHELNYLYVGQVSYRKGLHHLCESFLKTSSGHLNIIGSIPFDSNIYNKYKDETRITFLGHIAHESVREYMINSDVFLFASLTEGFSLSCLEALSCGLPVVCSKNSGTNDLIHDGYNGFVFDVFDEIKLIQIIEYINENKCILPQMSNNAVETAKGCTWNLYRKNLSSILKEVLG